MSRATRFLPRVDDCIYDCNLIPSFDFCLSKTDGLKSHSLIHLQRARTVERICFNNYFLRAAHPCCQDGFIQKKLGEAPALKLGHQAEIQDLGNTALLIQNKFKKTRRRSVSV